MSFPRTPKAYNDYRYMGLTPLTRMDFERIQKMARSLNTEMRVQHRWTIILVHEDTDLDLLVAEYDRISDTNAAPVRTVGPYLRG